MAIDYQDINNTVEECGNIGGIGTEVYYAPKSYFASLAKKPVCSALERSLPEMNQLSVGTDTLLPGKSLKRIYTTIDKGSLVGARQGETDGVSHKNTLTMYTPGLDSTTLGLLETPNQNWIFYVKTGGQMFRLGTWDRPAKMAAEGEVGTGAAAADARGNTISFYSDETGFVGEVVDQDAIEAMLIGVDTSLTAVFSPAQGDTAVLVDATPTITFSEAVINAATGVAFTPAEWVSAITLKEFDVNGTEIGDVPFTAVQALLVLTITPTADMTAATIHQVKFDATKVVSSAEKKRVNGTNFARFTTA
jgi:hypothetical protein